MTSAITREKEAPLDETPTWTTISTQTLLARTTLEDAFCQSEGVSQLTWLCSQHLEDAVFVTKAV